VLCRHFVYVCTKWIINAMYASTNTRLTCFKKFFGVLSRLCQEKGLKGVFSFQISPRAEGSVSAKNHPQISAPWPAGKVYQNGEWPHLMEIHLMWRSHDKLSRTDQEQKRLRRIRLSLAVSSFGKADSKWNFPLQDASGSAPEGASGNKLRLNMHPSTTRKGRDEMLWKIVGYGPLLSEW